MQEVVWGDCLEIMKDIPVGKIDMILCDLPYGTTACKWDTVIPFDKLWEQYERIIKPNGAIVLTAQTPFDKVFNPILCARSFKVKATYLFLSAPIKYLFDFFG